MKINEAEQLVGVTKKNIRFYEAEGLLSPARCSNGYRDYSEADVARLKRIKLLRKLSVPLEDIRRMESGSLTLCDCLSRHQSVLKREEANLRQMVLLCAALAESGQSLTQLDCDACLLRMEHLEQEGTRFMDVKKLDRRKKLAASVVWALVFVAFMLTVLFTMVWAFIKYPANRPPLPLMAVLSLIVAGLIVGVLLALRQRVHEIEEGEEDAVSKY